MISSVATYFAIQVKTFWMTELNSLSDFSSSGETITRPMYSIRRTFLNQPLDLVRDDLPSKARVVTDMSAEVVISFLNALPIIGTAGNRFDVFV